MKVAILTPTFSKFSGPDRVVLNEAMELAQHKNPVTIFTFKTDFSLQQHDLFGKNPSRQQSQVGSSRLRSPAGAGLATGPSHSSDLGVNQNIKVEVLGSPRNQMLERIYRLLFFLDIPKVMRIADRLSGFDEAVSFLYPMTLPAMIAKKRMRQRLKYVYYDVGVAYPQLFDSFLERAYMRVFAAFTKITIKNADSAVSISKFLSSELKKETGLESTVKYVKIDTKRFNSKTTANYRKGIAAVAKKNSLSKPVLLYVGRISPHKGVHLLLDAFRIIKEKIPAATLVVVGKHTFQKYSEQLQEKAGKIGGVVFAGFVPDEELPAYYGACDAYVTCSMWEGFDIPLVEANACGKPAVAFDVGSHPEVLKKGKLVRAGDVNGFADAVAKLLKK